MTEPSNLLPAGVIDLLARFQIYSNSRKLLLEQLGIPNSCRDPFAEFSEILVANLLYATIADSRVQKDYDLIRPDGRFVQVKYLSNPTGKWINEHTIIFPDSIQEYALVIFEALQVKAVLVFSKDTIGRVCTIFNKKHKNQERTLQLTKANYLSVISEKSRFEELGLELFLFNC